MAIRKNTKRAIAADHLLVTLYGKPISECPTDSRELSQMIYDETGVRYSMDDLNNLASWIRKNADDLGWTVPKMEPGGSTNRRWFVIVNGTTLSNPEIDAVEDGHRSDVKHALTRTRNSLSILELAMVNAPKGRRWLLKSALKVGRMYEDLIVQVLDLWEDEEVS